MLGSPEDPAPSSRTLRPATSTAQPPPPPPPLPEAATWFARADAPSHSMSPVARSVCWCSRPTTATDSRCPPARLTDTSRLAASGSAKHHVKSPPIALNPSASVAHRSPPPSSPAAPAAPDPTDPPDGPPPLPPDPPGFTNVAWIHRRSIFSALARFWMSLSWTAAPAHARPSASKMARRRSSVK